MRSGRRGDGFGDPLPPLRLRRLPHRILLAFGGTGLRGLGRIHQPATAGLITMWHYTFGDGQLIQRELSMLLEIDSLGRVVEAEIIQTSGNRLLDRKAQSIVRGAGPYGHFTPQMRAQFDRLVFVSRFRFTREQGLQATVEENQNAPQGR